MRIAAVLAGGILYALALPPWDWAVCGWLTLVPLLWAIRGQSVGSAFRLGLLYGYAAAWALTWCFAEAAARYFRLPLPVAVAVVGFVYAVVVGGPFGLFAAATAAIERSHARRLATLVVPAVWVATEFLRGRLMGQPWGLLGYTQYAQVALIQVAAVTGVYGVSFLLALGNVVIARTLTRDGRTIGQRIIALAGPAAVVGACWIGGAYAVRAPEPLAGQAHQVAVVQTNVAPKLAWTRAYTDTQVAAHVSASAALPPGTDLIVWPENSVPRYLEREPMLAVELATLAARHHADLLFGGPRYADGHTYNSARLITAGGRNGGHYDKHRLVLFAEEKPLAATESTGPNESPEQFTPGTGPSVLASFVPIGVSICHEIVHPDLITASVRDGAELLVNIANDGWLDGGYGFAGRQHLAMAVFRAVETRRFVVRGATTGTSAIIDPYGHLVATQPPDTAGVVTGDVVGLRTVTPYVQAGDAFALACVLVVVAGLLPWPRRLAFRHPHTVEAPAAS
jgi:apolipoprotein N-acyltransferase